MKTPATRFLDTHKISYTIHEYEYQDRGGTARSSSLLGVDEHIVVKTLVMETQDKAPLLILMHGDFQVDTKALARAVGAKSISPCKPEVANRHTGYLIGGTSPFGTAKALPVYMEKTIADLEEIFINGGGRGFLVKLSPKDLIRVLNPTLVTASRLPQP